MSVGHELLINPSIILLDEPTSGELPPYHHRSLIEPAWEVARGAQVWQQVWNVA